MTTQQTTASPQLTALAPEVFHVASVRRETADVFTMDIALPQGRTFSFLPGQFNMLYAFGAGESAISISGPPQEAGRLTHTIREVGGVTRALGRLRAGSALGVRGPYGRPWPIAEERGRNITVVAGGLGLAPVRPILYHVLANREDYGRVSLVYGTRTPEDILFSRELQEWRARYDLEVELTVDRAGRSWRGHVGVVTTLIGRALEDAPNTSAFVCGPEIMMRFAADELLRHGVLEERLFVSLERNMHCAVGLCGHCQMGGDFICKDGPVFSHDQVRSRMEVREL